ncbi:MAG: zinc ribbon domain-containing protein, partial [Deltaproteobacteria bacterium]|nr:zinc ribbon domain-containing protein [Deltaproteobacteria bacterium]
MRCTCCGFENPAGKKFCGECGAPLQLLCPNCGAANPPRFKFCGDCGTALTGKPKGKRQKAKKQFGVRSPESRVQKSSAFRVRSSESRPIAYTPKHLAQRILAEQAAMEARGVTEGERKTITALFADMAGFTALTRDLDPEDAQHIIDPALQLMMEAVHRYEGFVTQSLGDGIFAFFGAPIAHEDHPQRALYAALRMQEDMRRYSDKVRLEKGVPLQIRVGLNMGEVVLRSIRKDDLHADYVPIGHSTNLASRMEGLATAGSIVVSEHTY